MGPDLKHEKLLQHILANIPSGLFLVDRDQRIFYWNREAERITGYRADQVIGQHCSFLDGVPCGEFCGLFSKKVPKPVLGVTCSLQRATGGRITILKNMDYLRDEGGQIIGGVESFIDVTAYKKLEKKLRKQTYDLEHAVQRRTGELEKERTQLRNVLDAMSDFAYIASADHRIQFMNRAMVKTFGDHHGKACHKAFYNLDAPCGECPMAAVLEGQTVRSERTTPFNRCTYEIIDTPLEAPNGKIQKLAVYRDITARKEAEENLLEANRELDAFVYTVSHDLRTPLTPIIAYAEMLQTEYAHCMDDHAREMLQEIEGQGHRMLALLEDLLELARVGMPEPVERPVELARVLRNTIEELQDQIGERQAEIRIGSLPHLRIPRTFLSQLYGNLLGNALRYAAGPGKPIEIGSRLIGGRLLLYVLDHGPGIPEAERGTIFDLFKRGASASGTKGTGIGLATVRKIVRLYQGRIWVDETPGGGCTFWVEFPAELAESPAG
ncbi:hypothetical protein DESUT3_06600 [Desulfuromonas versatilis]|uniref:histidine kinase n=1 Tax=Desulfuromonas versatilis TaxID=2802975 RepID=A0ABN6DUC3_9BACT|nr:PAS domain-containing sensor histidine kinase [Desulfuromonas versatilis]BCR03591.1 hypothetical protein DESUT3_06600 [Desulfuromonas versatilis]